MRSNFNYRIELHLANQDINVFTRRGTDWTRRFTGDAFWFQASFAIIEARW